MATSYIKDKLIPIPKTDFVSKRLSLKILDENQHDNMLMTNTISSMDPSFSDQWGLYDSYFGWQEGWALLQNIPVARNKYRIAIIDTGIAGQYNFSYWDAKFGINKN
jgi:hypothetical protein